MPLTFRDHLKRDGWLPLTSFHRNRAITERVKVIEDRKRNRTTMPLKKSVQDLKDLIENNPDLYMGFIQMYKEAGPGSLVSARQSCPFIYSS